MLKPDNFLTSKFSEQMIVDFFFSEVSTEPAWKPLLTKGLDKKGSE